MEETGIVIWIYPQSSVYVRWNASIREAMLGMVDILLGELEVILSSNIHDEERGVPGAKLVCTGYDRAA